MRSFSITLLMLYPALAFAAEAPAAPPAPEYSIVQKLLEYGLLGVMFLIVLWFLRKRDNELQEERKGRLDDAKSLAKVIEDHNTTARALTQAQEARNVATEAMARAQEATARALEGLGKDIEGMSSAVHRSTEEQISYRKDIDQRWPRFVQDVSDRIRIDIMDEKIVRRGDR